LPFPFCAAVASVLDISGNVGVLGSIDCSGSISVTGLNTLVASALNLSVTLFASLVGRMPRLVKFINSNIGVSGSFCDGFTLGVLVIASDHLSVMFLLKGYAGPGPGICRYLGVNTDVGVEVTGVCDAGGLSSSAL